MGGWLLVCSDCVGKRDVKAFGVLRRVEHCEHCGAPVDKNSQHPWQHSRRDELLKPARD
jgi:hypothetical protein